jgi:hypothetical protein
VHPMQNAHWTHSSRVASLASTGLVTGLRLSSSPASLVSTWQNEMRDVMLCAFLVRQRVQDATPAWIPRALFVLSLLRQFGFLPRLDSC